MALGMLSMMLVTSAGFAETHMKDDGMSDAFAAARTDQGDPARSDLPAVQSGNAQAQDLKILSIRGVTDIRDTDKRKGGSSPDDQKILSMTVPNRKSGKNITLDEIRFAEGYSASLYSDPDYKESMKDIPIDANNTIAYIKVAKGSETHYYLLQIFLGAPMVKGEVLSVFKIPVSDKVYDKDGDSKEQRRIIEQVMDPKKMPVFREISATNIEKRDPKDMVQFYGTDPEFSTKVEGAVPIPSGKSHFYFTVRTEDQTTIYYELILDNKAENGSQDKDPKPKQDQQKPKQDPVPQNGGGSSSRSSVRPGDQTPPKADKKEGEKAAETKKSENNMDADQKNVAPMSKVSTKLMIGEKKYTVTIDGVATKKIADVAPMIHMGRTVLPARMISEVLGVDVKFDSASKTASFMYGENKVELMLGKKYMMLNKEKIELTADILNKDGRILLPLRDIQNAFAKLGLKANIAWDAESRSIDIEKHQA